MCTRYWNLLNTIHLFICTRYGNLLNTFNSVLFIQRVALGKYGLGQRVFFCNLLNTIQFNFPYSKGLVYGPPGKMV